MRAVPSNFTVPSNFRVPSNFALPSNFAVPSIFAVPSLVRSGNLLKGAFNYLPVTDWRRFFSPTIVFGTANMADIETEQHVVDSVGSYGFQLNRILDALAVLIREEEDPKARTSPRSEKDQIVLYRLLDLADKADEAARQAKKA